MAAVEAVQILKSNIVAMDKIPVQFRACWRMAVSEVNIDCKSAERLQSTRVKMGIRFGKFFARDFILLVDFFTQSSVRLYEQLGIRIPRDHTQR